MGLELSGNFSDNAWYMKNIDTIKSMIIELPSFVKQAGKDEFWLKAKNSQNSWDYDVRIFVQKGKFLIEASLCNEALHSDVKTLVGRVSTETSLNLLDDDGNMFRL